MTFEDLLARFESGFSLERLDELRTATAGLVLNKAQRKRLTTGIEFARTRARVGRIANLLLIGLVTDEDYWLDWIRRSAVLRPSAYDLDIVVPQKLLGILKRIAEILSLPPKFIEFLGNLETLFALAFAARTLRRHIIRRLTNDHLLVKSCLVTVDLLFIGRTEGMTLETVKLTPEDAAAALSYLIFLTRKTSGPSGILLSGIDPDLIQTGYYLNILEETKKVTSYFTWELLVFHFGYSILIADDLSKVTVAAPSPEFAKSLRAGFIRQEAQTHSFLMQSPTNRISLTEVAAKFKQFMEQRQLIRRQSKPDRWVFYLPAIPILTEYFSQPALFREEYRGLTLLCKDLLATMEELSTFEVEGVPMINLIKAQRMMYVVHRVRVEKLKSVWKADPKAAIQSVAAVYEDDSLINFLGYSLPADDAKKILALLEWKPEQKDYFDIMYQPIVRAAGNKILIAPNLFSTSNLPRNTLQLTQKRLGEKGDGLLAKRLSDELKEQGFLAWPDVSYKFGGIVGDCDVVALKGEYLFIFECKNSLHPCSTAELRTSYDHLVKGQSQHEKFASLWPDQKFKQYFSKRLGVKLDNVQFLKTAIITGNRMFGGLQLGDSKVLGFHELVSFIIEAKVVILDQEFIERDQGPLKPAQLSDFLTNAPWDQHMLAAMTRRDKVTSFNGFEVHVEDYFLRMIDLAKEWGVELTDEEKTLIEGP